MCRQSLRLIFLPVALPALAVSAILPFIFTWNQFVQALTNLRSLDNFTLTLKVFHLVGGRYSTVPVTAVFAWLPRYLVRGLALAAVK